MRTLLDGGHAGAGGPNLPPPGGGLIAECVAHAPGAPSHVLLTDTVAEHIPGCNMAFLRERLEGIGGFDPQFRTAGDDVDLCWRLQARGWTLGYSPAAVVWHHRRRTLRANWKQQRGYGAAEALLARKWPAKYNASGAVAWAGRLYGQGAGGGAPRRGRIYHGIWGTAPFQSVYDAAPGGFARGGALLAVATATLAAVRAAGADARGGVLDRWLRGIVTALLFGLQPAARLYGRSLRGQSTSWPHLPRAFTWPAPRRFTCWSESWRPTEAWLGGLESTLRESGLPVLRGGEYDDWDLEVRAGRAGVLRLRVAVEEHGHGRQLVRVRAWPPRSPRHIAWWLVLVALTAVAFAGKTPVAAASVGGVALLLAAAIVWRRGAVLASVRQAVSGLGPRPGAVPRPRTAEAGRAVASEP